MTKESIPGVAQLMVAPVVEPSAPLGIAGVVSVNSAHARIAKMPHIAIQGIQYAQTYGDGKACTRTPQTLRLSERRGATTIGDGEVQQLAVMNVGVCEEGKRLRLQPISEAFELAPIEDERV